MAPSLAAVTGGSAHVRHLDHPPDREPSSLGYRDAVTPDPAAIIDIDIAEARRLIDAGAFLLDVREDDEWEAGHAPEADHLAMGLVAEHADRLPGDRTVVCICRVGGRSGSVAGVLAGAGFDVRNVDGGMLAWELAGLPVVTADGGPGRII
jgi:rhodanese-related sulfurtransferase